MQCIINCLKKDHYIEIYNNIFFDCRMCYYKRKGIAKSKDLKRTYMLYEKRKDKDGISCKNAVISSGL